MQLLTQLIPQNTPITQRLKYIFLCLMSPWNPPAQSRNLTRQSPVADPTRTATPLPEYSPPNAHHPHEKNPNRSTNHPSQRPKTKQTRPLTESAPVLPLPSSSSSFTLTHKRVAKQAPKGKTKAKNITPSPPRVMVTVRNPTPKLSDELFRAMQTVLDALFNQRDPTEFVLLFTPSTIPSLFLWRDRLSER